jgi:hypothetical protein
MKSIFIGKDANGRDVWITPEMRRNSHMYAVGGTRTGKSKFVEWMDRQDIREGNGFTVVDWHGTLYSDLIEYCAQMEIGLNHDFRKIILINPSDSEFITGFNPFMNQGEDISTQVSHRIDATIRPWGITDTNVMPTFERVCRLLYTFAVEQRETLPNVAKLLQFDKPELREFAIDKITDSYVQQQWREVAQINRFRDWKDFVLSTENRLGRFLSSTTIKRFMGLKENNLDIAEAMDKGHIILINLGASGFLDREAARVFASLLLNEFFECAMSRAKEYRKRNEKPPLYTLYLDEFQEYITEDIGSMLDEVLKGGLHMVLAHQHLGHLVDNPRLLRSILTNARIRAVFGGLSVADASLLAEEMFLPELNERQIKKAIYHTVHIFDEQDRTAKSHTRGTVRSKSETWNASISSSATRGRASALANASAQSSVLAGGSGTASSFGSSVGNPVNASDVEGWFTEAESNNEFNSRGWADTSSNSQIATESESTAETDSKSFSQGGVTAVSEQDSNSEIVFPVWVPIPVQELASETEWTREEKLSKLVELLKMQQQGHCFIKLDTERTQPLRVPFVRSYGLSEATIHEYENLVYEEQGALAAEIVDKQLAENEIQFLAVAGRSEHKAEQPKQLNPPAIVRKGKSARENLFAKIRAS